MWRVPRRPGCAGTSWGRPSRASSRPSGRRRDWCSRASSERVDAAVGGQDLAAADHLERDLGDLADRVVVVHDEDVRAATRTSAPERGSPTARHGGSAGIARALERLA